jgi:hypothetical protein
MEFLCFGAVLAGSNTGTLTEGGGVGGLALGTS